MLGIVCAYLHAPGFVREVLSVAICSPVLYLKMDPRFSERVVANSSMGPFRTSD